MKKTVVFAIIATLIAATITGCGNKSNTTTSKATANEATFDSVSVVETVASTEQSTSVEPSSTAATEVDCSVEASVSTTETES